MRAKVDGVRVLTLMSGTWGRSGIEEEGELGAFLSTTATLSSLVSGLCFSKQARALPIIPPPKTTTSKSCWVVEDVAEGPAPRNPRQEAMAAPRMLSALLIDILRLSFPIPDLHFRDSAMRQERLDKQAALWEGGV